MVFQSIDIYTSQKYHTSKLVCIYQKILRMVNIMKNKIFLRIMLSSMVLTSAFNVCAATNSESTKAKSITSSVISEKQSTVNKDIELNENQKQITAKVGSATSTSLTFYEADNSKQSLAEGEKPDAAPAKPEGEKPDAAPEKPEGEKPDAAPAKPDGENGMNVVMWSETLQTLPLSSKVVITKSDSESDNKLSYTDIKANDQVRLIIETSTDGKTQTIVSIEIMGTKMGQGEGKTSGSIEGTTVYGVDAKSDTVDKKTYSADKANESAVKATNGAAITLTNATLNKCGDSTDTTESDFYGLNAAVLCTGGSSITIKDTKITTDAEGANAIFATQEGSNVTLSNVDISTKSNSSRGLDATYGGTITATDVNISTTGAHCAALATDRGEGIVTLTNGTLSTAGDGSPCIYSTGNITANNVVGTSTGAQAAVIEGKNSITLNNSDLTGAGRAGVMLYQSFSGDAGVGTSVLNMTEGKLTATEGPIFFVTNTDAIVNLKNTTLKGTEGLITAGVDRWGKEGSNGGHLTLNADSQELSGDIIADSISTVAVNLTNSTRLKSTINEDKTAECISLSLDKSSKWEVTGNSYLSVLKDEDTTFANIDDNGFTIYYDSTQAENEYLAGKTYNLTDDGKLTPIK